ncbi:MAG: discoidin domain-containing protein, partial [Acidimicrobiia bacterium]|nr:discoidin domain-containing protein [Acidimicrobiia bacterium]
GATVVAASSEFSASFAAANAVDGDLGTEWSSRGDGDDAFITIDLGQPTVVTAVAFRTRSMSDGSAIAQTFTVEVDGTTFGPFAAGPTVSEVSFEGQVLTYRVAASTGGNTGAIEVEAYSALP